MERFDVLVIGSGSGMTIVEGALNKGLRVAIVEKDQLGGTCLNRGCIPSKMVIYPTDVVQEIKHAVTLGVKATIDDIDFGVIMDRMRRSVSEDRHHMEEGVKNTDKLAYYPVMGEFTGDYRMMVGAEEIEAENIFLVSGARPDIPSIKGLDKVSYFTSRDVWDMKQPPQSMIIIGGGYIAAEMAHFFSGIGVEVKILSRGPLIRHEEPEIGETLTHALRARMVVRTGLEFVEVNESEGIKEVTVKEEKGEKRIYRAETILVAAGQRGNADLLKVEKTGVKADDHGYIKVNEFYETGKPRIWALGDAIGKAMFKHVANRETELVWHSFNHGNNQTIDYDKVPYAIFSYPQVAGVGITEEEATKRGLKYLVGGYAYSDTAYGAAMGEEDGFVKLMVEEETYKILGCHIVGPHAAILIHEVIVAMNAGDGSVYPLIDAMHIHPALNEVVQRAVWQLKKPVYNHT